MEKRMEHPADRILIIDDDIELCALLSEYLSQENFTIESVHDGERGTNMALSGGYGMVILDVMLPGGISGFEVLQRIRAKETVPVLMLSARGEDIDRIVGIEMGADDYLPKPFNPRELLARIRTILRRAKSSSREIYAGEDGICKVGDIRLDVRTRLVHCAEKPVELTGAEFSILEMLMKSPGQVLTREEMAMQVLGRPLSPYDRSIDVHVSRLRKKLGPHHSGADRIRSIRGSGYLLTVSLSSMAAAESRRSQSI